MTTATLPRGTTDVVLNKLFPKPNPHAADPEAWIGDRLREKLWSKQREIAQSVVENRHTAVHSCHDSGKSYIASRIAAWWLDTKPIGDAFVVSTAPSQTQVEAILWREIGKAHRKGDLRGRITSGSVPMWKVGQEIIGFGRKPQGLANEDEAMAAFQGIHTKYVLVVIDEGGGVPKWLFDAVDTLTSNEEARVLVIGNPGDPTSEFAKVCAPGSGWNTVHIGYEDTPAYTGEEVSEELAGLLLSPTWVEERRERWGAASPLFISKVLGLFPDIGEDTLIEPRWITEAQTRDLSHVCEGLGQDGWDIARYGSDKTVGYNCNHGVIRKVGEWAKMSLMKTAARIAGRVKPHVGGMPAVVDVIGLGGGVVDRLRERKVKGVHPFDASAKANRADKFVNRRAEVYWSFARAMERGDIDLAGDGSDDDLASQLGSIKWGVRDGRIKIESKEDMKKRGMPSPNHADACVMSWMPGVLQLPARGRSKRSTSQTITGDLMTREM